MSKYDQWKRHFSSMIEGKLNGDKKMLILNSKSQQGRGVEIVSPLQQTLDIAKARISMPVKRKTPDSKQQSPAKRHRKQTAPKKRTAGKNKKIKNRRKTIIRKR